MKSAALLASGLALGLAMTGPALAKVDCTQITRGDVQDTLDDFVPGFNAFDPAFDPAFGGDDPTSPLLAKNKGGINKLVREFAPNFFPNKKINNVNQAARALGVPTNVAIQTILDACRG